ncbi:MAG: hypothetical protein J2P18_07200 [Nocardia sp.]|nr:hypothetical protein [Nocardia sp.]
MTNPDPKGYEPQGIHSSERAQSWGNGELKDIFDALVPRNAFESSQDFAQMATLWQQGVETFARSINRSIAEAWEGASAEAAKNSIGNYSQQAQGLTSPLQELATHMNDTAEAIGRTKGGIPDPVHIDATSWLNPYHRWTLEKQQGEHRQEAWDAFINHYVTPLGQIDQKIPVLPAPADPARPPDAVPGNPGGSQEHSPMPGVGGQAVPPGGRPGGSGPGDHQPGEHADQQPDSSHNPSAASLQSKPGGVDGNSAPTSGPDPTHASGLDPSDTATNPSGVGAGSLDGGTGRPGGGSGIPGGGSGVPGGGSGGSERGEAAGPGRSVPGTGIPGVASTPAAAGMRGGAAGTAGMPGMGMPGTKKDKADDEKEHRSPDYLINADNARDLIGEEPRTLPGGVIGGHQADNDRPQE